MPEEVTETTETEQTPEEIAVSEWNAASKEVYGDDAELVEEVTPSEPEAQEEQAPAEPEVSEPEPVEDPWAGVNPALRKTIENMNNQLSGIENISNRLKQAENRVGSIQNKMHATEKAVKAAESVPTEKELLDAAKTKEKWADMEKEFPEFASAFEGRLKAELAAHSAGLAKNQPDIESIRSEIQNNFNNDLQQHKAALNDQMEQRIISLKHPGWQTTKDSQEFKDWFVKQDKSFQYRAVNERTAEAAIDTLDKFVADSSSTQRPSEIKRSREKRLETSQPMKTNKLKRPKSVDDMTPEEFWNYQGKKIWKNP